MKDDYTHITVVLDRSGSMHSIKNDAIGGYNEFLKGQQAFPGEATFTLAQFDDQYELVHDFKKIQDIPELTEKTYLPRGLTALLDAIGKTITTVGEKLSAIPENDRPGKVLFVILTDGQENNSREYKKDRIKEMITTQENTYKWKFMYLSCDFNAYNDAGAYGIAMAATLNYTGDAKGMRSAYRSLNTAAMSYRSGGTATFTDKDRDEQKR